MAFDPNSPAESHAVLSGDINQTRENFVQLRKHESGAVAPSNLVAGMLWYDTNGPYLKIRRSDNGGWYYIYLGTQACVEAGIIATPAQINRVAELALQTATGDGATTINWSLGNKMKFTFGAANETFTFTAPSNSSPMILILIQDGVGGRTATWPGTVKWVERTIPTLTTIANYIDIVSFFWDGTNYYGQAGLNWG